MILWNWYDIVTWAKRCSLRNFEILKLRSPNLKCSRWNKYFLLSFEEAVFWNIYSKKVREWRMKAKWNWQRTILLDLSRFVWLRQIQNHLFGDNWGWKPRNLQIPILLRRKGQNRPKTVHFKGSKSKSTNQGLILETSVRSRHLETKLVDLDPNLSKWNVLGQMRP